MNAMKKVSYVILFLALFNVSPMIALAGTLPDKQPSPELANCPGRALPIPATKRSLFGLDLSTGTSGYQCDIVSGSDNYYRLYYNNNSQYLGGLDFKQQKYFNPAGEYNDNPVDPQAISTLNKAAVNAATCGLRSFSFQTCIWMPAMAWLGSWFLTIGGGLVRLVGALFDLLVWKVIIGFGTTLGAGDLKESIEFGWTLFRDIANIIIIGMFIFIAIGIIIGLKEYGQKKFVAYILVIAVLLNFSLLFTRMIIDFSNFTAYQFYAAAMDRFPKYKSTDNQAGTAGGSAAQNFDIARAFLEPMGITSIWNTAEATKAAGQAAGNSGWAAFLYGLFGGSMLLWLAFVLAYGCFVIAMRGIMLVVLMITAAAAFATFIIPKFEKAQIGWSAWWGWLLNTAIFAPLLMIFLYISLRVIDAAAQANGAVSLNKFIENPSAGFSGSVGVAASGWPALFNFVLVSGLLLASFIISHKVAKGIPGMQFTGALTGALAKGALMVGTGGTAAVARVGLGAAAGRASTAGASAATRAQNLRNQLNDLKDVPGAARVRAGKELDARAAEALAESKNRRAALYSRIADSRLLNPSARRRASASTSTSGSAAPNAGLIAAAAGGAARQFARARAQREGGAADGTKPILEAITNQLDVMRRAESAAATAHAARNTAAQALVAAKEDLRKRNGEYAGLMETIEKNQQLMRDEHETYRKKIDGIETAHGIRRDMGAEQKMQDQFLQAVAPIKQLAENLSGGASIVASPDQLPAAIRQRLANVDPEQREVIDKQLSTLERQRDDGEQVVRERVVREQIATTNPDQHAIIEEQLRTASSQRESELRHQAENINQARARARRIEMSDDAVQRAQSAYNGAQLNLMKDAPEAQQAWQTVKQELGNLERSELQRMQDLEAVNAPAGARSAQPPFPSAPSPAGGAVLPPEGSSDTESIRAKVLSGQHVRDRLAKLRSGVANDNDRPAGPIDGATAPNVVPPPKSEGGAGMLADVPRFGAGGNIDSEA